MADGIEGCWADQGEIGDKGRSCLRQFSEQKEMSFKLLVKVILCLNISKREDNRLLRGAIGKM